MVIKFLKFMALIVGFFSCGVDSSSASLPIKKVMVVVYENDTASSALGQPFFRKLAKEGAFLSNMYAITHPSQPNYIAMIAGDTLGVVSNNNYDLDQNHLGDLLEAKGKTWKNYAEGLPEPCFKGAIHERYARKHVPFMSFKNVTTNSSRCKNIVEASELFRDVEQGTLPDFSFYTPDQFNDGHDTGIAYADRALEKTFGTLLGNPKFMDGMLFIVTFDEDNHLDGNRIYTSFYGDAVKKGAVSKNRYTHYSLLKLIEDIFYLGSLGRNDLNANPINDIWN